MIYLPIVNGLYILNIIRYKCLRTRMHIFIGTLAVSGLFVGLHLIPLDLMEGHIVFNENKEYCLSKLSVFIISLGGSSVSMLLMSIERLITIAYHLHSIVG